MFFSIILIKRLWLFIALLKTYAVVILNEAQRSEESLFCLKTTRFFATLRMTPAVFNKAAFYPER